MDEIIKRLSERLAARPSRRGFFSTIGKTVLGAAAIITGQGFFAQAAEAATTLHCCTGKACASTGCPAGSAVHYTWHCGHTSDGDSGDYYVCHDCYSNGRFVCTYATFHT
ncbi:MAG TPA: hypothetical protein VKR83_06430 [Ktedonobacteraceae bacterium]|nr:hypothetical protein [Ktedonobacteraceae bacterium]